MIETAIAQRAPAVAAAAAQDAVSRAFAPWSVPVAVLKGVGARTAAALAQNGIHTVFDLLLHLPLRYEDKTRLTPLEQQRPDCPVFIEGHVEKVFPRFGRRRSWAVKLITDAQPVHLRFFQAGKGFKIRFAPDTRLRCYGTLRQGSLGLEIIHPQTTVVTEDSPFAASLTAVYPRLGGIGQATFRRLIDRALEMCADNETAEVLDEVHEELGFWAALRLAHRAVHADDLERARRRLALDELVGVYLDRHERRNALRGKRAWPMTVETSLESKFRALLPFRLTAAQEKARDALFADLGKCYPMQRLLQGDVGSGKTVVAALAALRAVEAGSQAAVMAPTELLAGQHFATLRAWFEPLGVDVALLSSSVTAPQRAAALERMIAGAPMIVTGTHALVQEAARFARLGLVIVDEQHRFGVGQRMALRAKGEGQGRSPHMLLMSATPIPRTLALTQHADLDVTTLDETPPGRTPVVTAAMPASRRAQVAARIAQACARGEQAYWICPAIVEREDAKRVSVDEVAAVLRRLLPQVTIDVVHGRMRPDEKAVAMSAFQSGATQLLVATTVVEVGVDVPNATRIVIENAELLGLAQLHQLRGRVGRGAKEGACVLLFGAPLSESARDRLAVLRQCHDGFAIAEQDLIQRGPGELQGYRQSGALPFKVADLSRDESMLKGIAQAAERVARAGPREARLLIARWGRGATDANVA